MGIHLLLGFQFLLKKNLFSTEHLKCPKGNFVVLVLVGLFVCLLLREHVEFSYQLHLLLMLSSVPWIALLSLCAIFHLSSRGLLHSDHISMQFLYGREEHGLGREACSC